MNRHILALLWGDVYFILFLCTGSDFWCVWGVGVGHVDAPLARGSGGVRMVPLTPVLSYRDTICPR